MGGRWLSQVWFLFVLILAGCGDNVRNNHDAGPVDAIDAPDPDAPIDGPPDAACSAGETPMYCTTPGGCTDLDVDPLNCGACGTTCDTANGAMCLDGVCCDSGQVNCAGTCVDLQADETSCGVCGVTCTADQTCTSGECRDNCTGTTTNCGPQPGVCVDTMTDPDFCGDCGTACSPGTACVGGQCQCDTPDVCSGVCTDTNNDPLNCGACGVPCGGAEVCNNGVCTTTCLAPTTNCSGSCANLDNDPFNCGQCGTACDAGEVCNAGTCTTTCTSPTPTDCNGACANTQTDPANCGACGTACELGATCASGTCTCPASEPNKCDGVCVDFSDDEANCGACNNACGASETCTAGTCRTTCPLGTPDSCGPAPGLCTDIDTDESNCGSCGFACTGGKLCGNGTCSCPPGTTDCNGQCVILTNNDQHCGACNNTCAATASCAVNTCLTDCDDPQNPDRCGVPGTCVDLDSDEATCGSCNTACTIAGQSCTGGMCLCDAPADTLCNGTCTDTDQSNAHCGGCNLPCGVGELCSGGACVANCDAAGPFPDVCNNACTNTDTDESNCGTCGTRCPIGGTCTAGVCACPAGQIDCNGMCVNTEFDPENCGACSNVCSGGSPRCTNGECCGFNETGCDGQCVDTNSDPNHCGACVADGGEACAGGASCNSGTCECPFGTELCNGVCIQTDTDPANCGGCTSDANTLEGVVCPGNQACVSGGCVSTCPAPLQLCNGKCVNFGDDNANCGNCGNSCPTGPPALGCSDGACVPKIVLTPPVGSPFPPAKCVGGGPPISVPTSGGGTSTCTGNLGAVSFNFGLCSCTNIGPLSQPVTTDAFNSTFGPYVPTCTTDANCGARRCTLGDNACATNADCTGGAGDVCEFPIKCVITPPHDPGDPPNTIGRCVGGGIGVNGTISNTAAMKIGGDFWVWGASGMSMKGDIDVGVDMEIRNQLSISKLLSVNEDAYLGGAVTASSGQTDAQVLGTVFRTGSTACATLPAILQDDEACLTDPAFVHREPCACDGPPSDDLVDVRFITQYFSDPAHNDNDLIGLDQTILTAPSGPQRLELPCGYYYLDSIGGSQPITIMVTGRTGLFIGGSIRPTQELYIDLQPGSTLDVFVGGVMTTSQTFYIGNPSYPRLSRVYLGSAGCAGSGTCTADADCCSGICNGGICNSMGGSLSEALQLSGSSYLNGVFYAGHGTVRISNPLEMYGAIFANYYEASGPTIIHYDQAITAVGEECPPPTGTCDSCRDCNNQACVGGTCGACTSDAQCCSPLECVSGVCQ